MQALARFLTILALVIGFAAAAPPAQARQAEVTTRNGRTFTGELVSQDSRQVVIEIAGIRTPINRSDIVSIEYKQDPDEAYAQRRAELADDDFEGRYNLASDLYDEGALEQALTELRSIEQDFADADMHDVHSLRDLVQLRIEMSQREPRRPAAPAVEPPPAARPSTAPRPTQPAEQALLTEEQINTIRLWELPQDLAEAQPRVAVPREVIDDLFQKYSTHEDVPRGADEQRRFRAQPGWQQLAFLFQIKARDLYPRVQVHEDPQPLLDFRRRINPIYVVRYFHENFGQGRVPDLDLELVAQDPNSIAGAYTNFYILSTAQYQEQPLINRAQPLESLLIQWGLPRDAAKYQAPQVENWRPFFRGLDDPRLQMYLDWIASLYPNPDYQIEYPPQPQADQPPAQPQ